MVSLQSIIWVFLLNNFSRVINLLLTTALGPYCQDLGPIFSQYGPRAWLIRCIYLTSIADKPEVTVRSFCSPAFISVTFYAGVFKANFKLHSTERSRSKAVRSGNRTWDLLHKGRALTDCAFLAPECNQND